MVESEKSLTARLGGPAMVTALIVACAAFMEYLDSTIIVTALPSMAKSFGVGSTRVSLGVTSYILTLAACIPASGWLAARVGGRNLFCAAIGTFTLSSMLCGLAPSFPAFIAARIVQGAAAAMMSPVGRLIVLRQAKKEELLQALSTLVWPALFAPVLGPPLGGLITSAASWRWIFYLNLPLGLGGMALVWGLIRDPPHAVRTPFDTAGFVLTAAGLASLTAALDVLGARPIALGRAAGLMAVAAAAGALAWRRLRTAAHPLVELGALRRRSFFIASISGGTLSRAAISATPFLLPLMFQLGFGFSPVASGLLLLVYMAANLAMKAVTNPIMRRFGLRRVLMVNGALAGAAIAACAIITPSAPLALTAPILLLAGATRSMQFTALTMVTFADIASEERAPAAVLSSLTQQLGMGMGVALGALLLNFSQIIRGAPHLAAADFRLALVLVGLLSVVATRSYAALAPDAGAEISGHRPTSKPAA